ncbi:MAG: succinylglutamate desuccinylase/aspartoacylase family protein [Pseudomonadales bacterium]
MSEPDSVSDPDPDMASDPVAEELSDIELLSEDDIAKLAGERVLQFAGVTVPPGTRTHFQLRSSEDFLTGEITTWGEVLHGAEPGPVLCLTAGIHGDELNGIEIVRRVLENTDVKRLRGVLVGVPIVNAFGFVNQSRYLPDRRDLNRYFPGRVTGSMASRIAWELWSNVIVHCTHLIDLHTGSQNRTNLPQIRGDINVEAVKDMARAFDAPLVIHNPGVGGTLRSAATRRGIPAILYEAGETLRFQADEIERGALGIRNVMGALGMRRGRAANLGAQQVYTRTRWLRADRGGILHLKLKLGDTVKAGERIGEISDPLRRTRAEFFSSHEGWVIGLSLLPMVTPGMAVVHLGVSGRMFDATQDPADIEEEMDPDRPE